MSQVNEIVEDILAENDLDWDHPVVPFLLEDVEQALDELSKDTLRSYIKASDKDNLYHRGQAEDRSNTDKQRDKFRKIANKRNRWSITADEKLDKKTGYQSPIDVMGNPRGHKYKNPPRVMTNSR